MLCGQYRCVVVAATATAAVGALVCWAHSRRKRRLQSGAVMGYAALIGNTPLVTIQSLSELTGRTISVKCEHMNPGGTGKDRIAQAMIAAAVHDGRLQPGGCVIEGTSGSTGIALASLCASMGYKCIIVMPDDQASEKVDFLLRLGAVVHKVKPAAISNPKHYVNVARRLAEDTPGAVFMNQFETLANFRVHASTTGCEIWAQAGGQLDAFVMSAGTGGTIAGVSQVLKEKSSGRVKVVLADPPGSSLLNWVKHGVCFNAQQSERKVRKNRYESIAEGIGLDRVTSNLAQGQIDDAVGVSDQDAVHMAHYLLRHEGLYIGSSSAMNLAAAVNYSARLPAGSHVVTVLCDSGARHGSRFWNQTFVENEFNLTWPTPEEADTAVAAIAQRERNAKGNGPWGPKREI